MLRTAADRDAFDAAERFIITGDDSGAAGCEAATGDSSSDAGGLPWARARLLAAACFRRRDALLPLPPTDLAGMPVEGLWMDEDAG
jgi:hypothetical protein